MRINEIKFEKWIGERMKLKIIPSIKGWAGKNPPIEKETLWGKFTVDFEGG